MALKNAASGGNFVMVVGLQMLVGSAALAVPAIAFETYSVAWSLSLVVAFTYTTLVPGLAATLVWFFLVDRIGALKAATFHFLNPFFGVTIAALILGERLGLLDLVGVVVIMLGILAVQISRQPGR
jgi:probable blue pigment (indigoidine) exporter